MFYCMLLCFRKLERVFFRPGAVGPASRGVETRLCLLFESETASFYSGVQGMDTILGGAVLLCGTQGASLRWIKGIFGN
jgi:hypothetical protein